jgi:hypothetical protein
METWNLIISCLWAFMNFGGIAVVRVIYASCTWKVAFFRREKGRGHG